MTRKLAVTAALCLSLSAAACLCGGGRARGAEPFTDIGAGFTGVADCSLAWGDYDGDGDLHLALSGWGYDGSVWGEITSVYRNDGGTFTGFGAGLTAVSQCSLAWGDYDTDGELDLALAGASSSCIHSQDYRSD